MPVNSFDDYPMSWRPDIRMCTGPKYIALARLLEADIKAGMLTGGTKLPPQRELADFLDVNLSTVSRAFKLCEQKGLICASVGNGTFVSSDVGEEKLLLLNSRGEKIIEMGAIIPTIEPNQKIKKYLEKMLSNKESVRLFSYGAPEAEEGQQQAGKKWLSLSGMDTQEKNIVQAAGGQNAILAAMRTLFQWGDRIGTDAYTYPGIKNAAQFLGIQLIPIQMDHREMTEKGIRYAIQNENIKGLYVIPDYQNPTAHIMSLQTRKMIAEIAIEQGITVIEDGINSMLMSKRLPAIASFAPEHVIYLSSLSKTISAGIRVAYMHVPEQYYQTVVSALYSMNIAISPMMANLAKQVILDGVAEEIVKERTEVIRKRNELVNHVFEGYNVEGDLLSPLRWLNLPEYFTGKSFEICAKEAGVQIYGAERFAVGNKPVEKAVRISVTTPSTQEEFMQGLQRIRRILRQQEDIAYLG